MGWLLIIITIGGTTIRDFDSKEDCTRVKEFIIDSARANGLGVVANCISSRKGDA